MYRIKQPSDFLVIQAVPDVQCTSLVHVLAILAVKTVYTCKCNYVLNTAALSYTIT